MSMVGSIILVSSPNFRQVEPSPSERIFSLPGSYTEDIFRVVSMGLCGLTLGFLWFISSAFRSLNIDQNDRLIRPLSGVALSYFLLTLFSGLDMLSRFGTNYMTWRMPVASAAFLISTVSLWVLLNRIRYIARRAQQTNSTVKITVSDTSKPGPDIDLATGQDIVK